MKRIVWFSMILIGVLGLFTNLNFAAEMKTMVMDIVPNNRPLNVVIDNFVATLANAGFVEGQNLVVHRLHDQNLDAEIAQIRQLQPDVIFDTRYDLAIAKAFCNTSTPVLAHTIDTELLVDPYGQPCSNITGLYSLLEDMAYNSYKFLQKVAPLKPGQQAVFLEDTQTKILTQATVTDALQRLQIPLKAVVNATVYEDWQAAILQYNDDPDVGWLLMGTWPSVKRDGTTTDLLTDCATWQREHLEKPTVTYWEFAVQWGTLAAFGIDSGGLGTQFGDMAARVLQGEDIKTIKAEYPRKVSIVLNRKTAATLGIVFPMDVLKLADAIYDDYEGEQVIRK